MEGLVGKEGKDKRKGRKWGDNVEKRAERSRGKWSSIGEKKDEEKFPLITFSTDTFFFFFLNHLLASLRKKFYRKHTGNTGVATGNVINFSLLKALVLNWGWFSFLQKQLAVLRLWLLQVERCYWHPAQTRNTANHATLYLKWLLQLQVEKTNVVWVSVKKETKNRKQTLKTQIQFQIQTKT